MYCVCMHNVLWFRVLVWQEDKGVSYVRKIGEFICEDRTRCEGTG